MARELRCPKCEGTGSVRAFRLHHDPVTYREVRKLYSAPCIVCAGTGTASLLVPMRSPGPARPVGDEREHA